MSTYLVEIEYSETDREERISGATAGETMSKIADDIKAAIDLANDSYAEGYRQGVLEGKRQMLAEVQAILSRTDTSRNGSTVTSPNCSVRLDTLESHLSQDQRLVLPDHSSDEQP